MRLVLEDGPYRLVLPEDLCLAVFAFGDEERTITVGDFLFTSRNVFAHIEDGQEVVIDLDYVRPLNPWLSNP